MEARDRSGHGEDLFGRFVAALLRNAEGDAVLVGLQAPVAVLELVSDGSGVVVIDATGALAAGVGQRATGLVERLEGGWVTVVATGGDDEVKAALRTAGKGARDPRRLSLYHLARADRLERLVGGRVSVVERAAPIVASTAPLAPDALAAIIERGKREREEAVNFAAQMQGRRPHVTRLLVGACVLLFALGKWWARSGSWDEVLVRMGANAGVLVAEGEIWRLLSSAFLHGNELHLAMNMLGLWSFGGFLEPVLGWRRYLVVYGAAALLGSLASAFIGRPAFSVGASGALWGLMLAGFALSRSKTTVLPARLARGLRQHLVGLLGINLVLSFVPRVDLYAHLGGGLAGFALLATGLLAPRALGAVGDEPAWVRMFAPVAAALLALSVAAALLKGLPWLG